MANSRIAKHMVLPIPSALSFQEEPGKTQACGKLPARNRRQTGIKKSENKWDLPSGNHGPQEFNRTVVAKNNHASHRRG
jgi:hypothetical protein